MPSNSLDNLIGKRDIKGLKTLLVQTFPSDDCAAISKALAELGFKPEHDDVGRNNFYSQSGLTHGGRYVAVPALHRLILLKDRKTYEKCWYCFHNVDENGTWWG